MTEIPITTNCREAFLHFLVRGRKPLICKKGLWEICASTYAEAVGIFGHDDRPPANQMRRAQPPE